VTTGEGSSAKRKGYWGLAALLIAVGVLGGFTHWHINYTPHGRYTCAELVVTAYQQAGVRLIPEKDVDEIAPADLARLLPPASLPRQ
jgi:hypothetical protein